MIGNVISYNNNDISVVYKRKNIEKINLIDKNTTKLFDQKMV